MQIERPEILPLGVNGILVRFSTQLSLPANRAALAFRGAILDAKIDEVSDLATSLTSCLVRFDPGRVSRTTVVSIIEGILGKHDWSKPSRPSECKLWRIPVSFGSTHGPQLDEVSDLVGKSPSDAVRNICATELSVLALGFAPGQPYLGFLDQQWDIPRQAKVNPEVPRGAIVVAVRQVIPFANPAPTGWRQIGRTAFRCYDAKLKNPIPLQAGDSVRFEEVSAREMDRLLQADLPFGGADCENIS